MYKALHVYQIPNPAGDGFIILGKVLQAHDGSLIFSRREPRSVAELRIRGAYSIDVRALAQWERDGIRTIQLIDATGYTSCTITRADWLKYEFREEHNAGQQSYVNIDLFKHYPEVLFSDADFTRVIKKLPEGGPTKRAWVPLTPPPPPDSIPQRVKSTRRAAGQKKAPESALRGSQGNQTQLSLF